MFFQFCGRVATRTNPLMFHIGQKMMNQLTSISSKQTTFKRQFCSQVYPKRKFSTTNNNNPIQQPQQRQQEPIFAVREQVKQFQPETSQRFSINSSQTYSTTNGSRIKTAFFGDIGKDPSKLLSLIFLSLVLIDMNITHYIFSEGIFDRFFEAQTLDRVADTKRLQEEIAELEVQLAEKRLQVALEGKSSLFSPDETEREFAKGNFMVKHSNMPLKNSIIGKLESRRKEWQEHFGMMLAQKLSTQGRLHPLKISEINQEMWYGELAQRGAVDGPNLMKLTPPQNLTQQISSLLTTPLPLLDPSITPTNEHHNYAYFLYNTIRDSHHDISHNAMLSASPLRLELKREVLNNFPLLLKEMGVYIAHHFNTTYIQQYNIQHQIDQYMTKRFDLWMEKNKPQDQSIDHDNTQHQYEFTPPCDLYEYYRGENGVIKQGVEFHTLVDPIKFAEDQKGGILTSFMNQIEPLEPYKWNTVALNAAKCQPKVE